MKNKYEYSYCVDNYGTLFVYENGYLMAEISDVKENKAFEMFKEIVYEMRNIDLN